MSIDQSAGFGIPEQEGYDGDKIVRETPGSCRKGYGSSDDPARMRTDMARIETPAR